LNEVTKTVFDIHRSYISVNAPGHLNLGENILLKINNDLKSTLTTTVPKLESIFTNPQQEIESIVALDIYPRFVRHQLTKSAAKALAGNRSKYAGLGDCFVMTNPAIADNPIVYASDGFVKVTGYPRADIISRNCRFLQGRYSDRQSVKRIRVAIDATEESVELLLNYKKNGEPFWNLLYISKAHATSFDLTLHFPELTAPKRHCLMPTAPLRSFLAGRSTVPPPSTAAPTSCALSQRHRMLTKTTTPQQEGRQRRARGAGCEHSGMQSTANQKLRRPNRRAWRKAC
jgi:PAS domain-containing protein